MHKLNRIIAITFAIAVALAARAQRLGPEVPLAPPLIGTATGEQLFGQIATNGTTSLVTWLDTRSSGVVLYAARLDARGKLLDATGIPIMQTTEKPFVAASGNDFVIVTSDCAGMHFIRVSSEGVATLPQTVDVSAGVCHPAKLVTNGENFLLVSDGSTQALLLDREGRSLGDIDTKLPESGAASVSTDGRDYLIAKLMTGDERSQLITVPVSRRGAVGERHVTAIAGERHGVDVAWNGHSYLVVTGGDGISTTEVAADGAPLSTTTSFDAGSVAIGPHLVWAGSDFVLAVAREHVNSSPGDDLFLWHLDARGTPAGAPAKLAEVTRFPAVHSWALVPFDGGVFTVISDRHLFGAKNIEPLTSIALAPAVQGGTKLVPMDSGTVAVWLEETGDLYRIEAQRLASDGRPSGEAVELLRGDIIDGTVPEIDAASDGTHLLVAMSDPAMRLLRFTADLQPFGSTALDGIYAEAPHLAASDGVAVVAWRSYFSPIDYNNVGDVYAARVDTNAAVLTPMPIAVPKLPFGDFNPAVANAGAAGFVIVWEHELAPHPRPGADSDPPADVVAVRIARSGAVLDAEPKVLAHAVNLAGDSAIACNGEAAFVAWPVNAGNGETISGKRVPRDLTTAGDAGNALLDSGTQPIVEALEDGWIVSNGRSGLRRINDGGVPAATFTLPLDTDAQATVTDLLDLDGSNVMISYSRRPNAAEVGGVERAYVRVVGVSDSPRRRPSRR